MRRGKHKLQQADSDVATTLVAGLTGIHPRRIGGFVLLADNTECGTHLTHSVCCSHHALTWALAVAQTELDGMTPCSGESS